MENENVTKQYSGLPSRSLNCSADGHGGNAKRFTPEQRSDAIIKKWQSEKTFIIYAYYRDNIAAEIREAVELEREACAEIAETNSILDWVGGSTGNAKGTAMQISKVIRSRTE